MVENIKPLVTITGVSGFIGSRVCLDFLQSGEFRVRGTVRDLQNEAKIKPLRQAFGLDFDALQLVEADLLDSESIEKAIEGSTYVVHTASPVIFPKNEEEVIRPAIEGTLAVLNACLKNKIKRCVITSSVAAVCAMADSDKPDKETGQYDESCWSNPDRPQGLQGYTKSKTLAEQAVWEFQQSLSESQRFEIVTICPSFVQGPSLLPGGFESADYIKHFFDGSQQTVSAEYNAIVDVRDVSKMHLESIRRPEVANQRFIAHSGNIFENEIVQEFQKEFGPKGFTVPQESKVDDYEKDARVSNEKACKTFKMEFITPKEACLAMAHSLIELGVITKI